MSRVYQCDVCGNVRDRGTISKFYKKGISLSSRTYEEKIKRSFHICDECVDKIVRIIRREQEQ